MNCPLADRGHGSWTYLHRVSPSNDDRDGGVGDRTLSSIGRADHQGIVSSPTRSRRRPTTSLFTEDIAMTSAVLIDSLEPHGTEPSGPVSCSPGPGQGRPGSPGPGQGRPGPAGPAKVAPAPQAPAKIAPAPQAPAKIAPAPQAPAKIAPAPQAPAKIAPAPQAPAKIAPAPRPRPRSPRPRRPRPRSPRRPRPRPRSPRPPGPGQDRPGSPGPGQGRTCSAGCPLRPGQGRPGSPGPGQGRTGSAGCPLRPGQGRPCSPGDSFCPRQGRSAVLTDLSGYNSSLSSRASREDRLALFDALENLPAESSGLPVSSRRSLQGRVQVGPPRRLDRFHELPSREHPGKPFQEAPFALAEPSFPYLHHRWAVVHTKVLATACLDSPSRRPRSPDSSRVSIGQQAAEAGIGELGLV